MSSSWRMEMNHLAGKYRCLFIVLLSFLSAGCQALLPGHSSLPLCQQMAPLPPGAGRVAVLPFLNDSDFPLADAIFSKVFAGQLSAAGTYLIQDGDILKVYQQLHLLPGQAPTLEQMQIVADRVNAQLLVTGTVLEMREDRGEHGTVDPMLVVEIQLRDGRSGETLWTTFHRRQGNDYKKTMHFGTIHTVTGLSRQIAVEIINLWQKKGLSQCSVQFSPS